MPQRKYVLAIALCALLFVGAPELARSQGVPEIARPGLGDIAVATMTPQGPVIFYDPFICRQMGLACGFFRAHEYGHVMLGHVLGGIHPAAAEMQADCFGAQNASGAEVRAAIQLFLRQGNGGDPVHGTGYQRAQRVHDARTAGQCHW